MDVWSAYDVKEYSRSAIRGGVGAGRSGEGESVVRKLGWFQGI